MLLSDLTCETLRANLSYDPATGLFTRLKTGLPVGFRHKQKHYVNITIAGKTHRAHRLAWLYMTGTHPTGVIDHINVCRTDNRWANLRDIKHALNLQNRRLANKNTSTGVLGVGNAKNGRYKARITVAGKAYFLGYFATLPDAQAAYLAAKAIHHIASPAP